MKSTSCTLFHQFSNHLADTLHNALSRDSHQIDFPGQGLSCFREVGIEFQTIEAFENISRKQAKQRICGAKQGRILC